MQITMKIDGEEKTFVNDFVPARLLREALKLNEDIAVKQKDGTFSLTDQLDKMAEFTVKAFNHQFTLDELWDGIALNKFQGELSKVFNNVLSLGDVVLVEGDNEGKQVD